MNLEILRSYLRVMGVALVVFGPVLGEILGEGFLCGLVQAGECSLGRAEIFSEEGDSFGGAEGIIEEQLPFAGLEARDFSCTRTQAFGDNLLDSPE